MAKARTLDGLFSDLFVAEFDYRHTSDEVLETYRSLGAEPPTLSRADALEALQKARNAVLARAWGEGAESVSNCHGCGIGVNPYET